MLFLPDPLPRGIHHMRYYRHGGRIPIVAVTGAGMYLDHWYVSTPTQLQVAVARLRGRLDAEDPLPADPDGSRVLRADHHLQLVR